MKELIDRAFAPHQGRIDILFIFPPTTIAERYGKGSVGNSGGDLPPLGIAYIAAYLREHGFGVGILDGCALGLNPSQILEILREKQPKCIGISSTTFALPTAVSLSERIRAEFPEKLLILGGAHANAVPEHAMEVYNCFDLVVYGEGELTTEELLKVFTAKQFSKKKFLEDYETLNAIRGLVYKNGCKIIKTPPRPVIQDLDSLPLPARDLLPHEKYIPLPNQYKKTPLAHIVAIRGCPFACSFCDQAKTQARWMSPKRAVEEIWWLKTHYGIREISFWDDTMTFNKKWLNEFCGLLAASKLKIIWSCYAAIRTLDLPMLKLMKKAGCWNIFYGIETGNPVLMKNIHADKKNLDPENIRRVVAWTKQAGIEIRGSFMLALPGETPQMALDTIRFAIELDPDYAQFSITTPYPGTKLYDEIKTGKWGRLTTGDFSEFQGWNVVFLPEGYRSKEEVWEIEKKAFRSFYFRPKFILKKLFSARSLTDLKRYVKGLNLLLQGFAYGPMPAHIREATGRN